MEVSKHMWLPFVLFLLVKHFPQIILFQKIPFMPFLQHNTISYLWVIYLQSIQHIMTTIRLLQLQLSVFLHFYVHLSTNVSKIKSFVNHLPCHKSLDPLSFSGKQGYRMACQCWIYSTIRSCRKIQAIMVEEVFPACNSFIIHVFYFRFSVQRPQAAV